MFNNEDKTLATTLNDAVQDTVGRLIDDAIHIQHDVMMETLLSTINAQPQHVISRLEINFEKELIKYGQALACHYSSQDMPSPKIPALIRLFK